MITGKLLRIGFDLDGVIIDKPPLVSRKIIEWLYRSHNKRELSYRYPKTRLEILIRKLSHNHKLRPPIKKNLEFINKLSKNKKYELFIISGRYSFLEKQTQKWFEINGLNKVFKAVHLNMNNEQPHVFKEKILKKIKPDIYFEDDELIVKYLTKKLYKKGIKIYFVNLNNNLSEYFIK